MIETLKGTNEIITIDEGIDSLLDLVNNSETIIVTENQPNGEKYCVTQSKSSPVTSVISSSSSFISALDKCALLKTPSKQREAST